MNTVKIFLFVGFVFLPVVWSNSQAPNSWIEKNAFPSLDGERRFGAFSFVIDNKAYVGSGANGTVGTLKDFWLYNPQTDTWTQRQNASGLGRYDAIAFAIGAKGYMGTGEISNGDNSSPVNDFYEYDPVADLWTIKPNVGITGRRGAVSFVIGNKGYVTCGYGGGHVYNNQLWEFDPLGNNGQGSWTERPQFPGPARDDAGGFAIRGTGYIVGGQNTTSNEFTPRDVWSYTQLTRQWVKKGMIPSEIAMTKNISCFVSNSKAYWVDARWNYNGNPLNIPALVEYNPSTNTYKIMNDVPHWYEEYVAFSLCDMGFVGTGGYLESSSKFFNQYFPDWIGMSGSDIVCSSSSTFTINTPPNGSSIVWTKSSNLNYVSGQGTSSYKVSAGSNGAGWVKVVVNTACNVPYYQQKNVHVGPYSSSNYPISGPSSACNNQAVYYSVPSLAQATNYLWTWPSGWTYTSGQGTNSLALKTGNTSGAVTIRVDNLCGPGGSPSTNFTTVNQCGTFSVSAFPNPASDNLSVTIESDEANQDDLIHTAQLTLYDECQDLVFSLETSDITTTIPVSNLAEGRYLLNVQTEKGIVQKQIVLQR